MTFAGPWAFVGFLALPALVAIYWLRQRAQRHTVSSLMLWRPQPFSRSSGRRLDRFKASKLFWLEALILSLLVLAAAGPQVMAPAARAPLVLVLDDSLSMAAGGTESPQAAAMVALQRELRDTSHKSVTLILAGQQPQVIGAGAVTSEEAVAELASWHPRAAVARIDEAVGLAAEIGGPRARILVVSDRPPPIEDLAPPELGERVKWWAFGQAAANVAIVNALRSRDESRESLDSCLVEIANFSAQSVVVRPLLVLGEENMPPERLELAAGGLARWRFTAPKAATAKLRLAIEGSAADASSLDDQVLLLPQPDRRVRVSLELSNPEIKQQVASAVGATQFADLVKERPELWISDGSEMASEAVSEETWQLRVRAVEPAVPYLGPFIFDRSHPLTEGLSLEGVIWGAGKGARHPLDTTIIAAGEIPLLSGRGTAQGRQLLNLFWNPDLSNVQQTTNWPILWWNLLSWRSRSVPGLQVSNYRLGSRAVVGLRSETATLLLPDGTRRTLTSSIGQLEVDADQLGLFQVTHGGVVDRWSVNALAAEESDLRSASSGRWGDWGAAAEGWERQGIGWIFLLLAMVGLAVHLAWTTRREFRE